MSWTDERVELLKKMWGEGQSASHRKRIGRRDPQRSDRQGASFGFVEPCSIDHNSAQGRAQGQSRAKGRTKTHAQGTRCRETG